MVAVAIIGTAASLAVPRYMKDMKAERQAECPRELNKIVAAQQAFFQAHQRYSANLADLDWKPPAKAVYLYGFHNGSVSKTDNPELSADKLPKTTLSPQHFIIGCIGNLDTDPELDIFTIDEQAKLVHLHNDRQ